MMHTLYEANLAMPCNKERLETVKHLLHICILEKQRFQIKDVA